MRWQNKSVKKYWSGAKKKEKKGAIKGGGGRNKAPNIKTVFIL